MFINRDRNSCQILRNYTQSGFETITSLFTCSRCDYALTYLAYHREAIVRPGATFRRANATEMEETKFASNRIVSLRPARGTNQTSRLTKTRRNREKTEQNWEKVIVAKVKEIEGGQWHGELENTSAYCYYYHLKLNELKKGEIERCCMED